MPGGGAWISRLFKFHQSGLSHLSVLPAREDGKCGSDVPSCVLATVVDFGTLDSETQALTGGRACEPIVVRRVMFQKLARLLCRSHLQRGELWDSVLCCW